MFLLQEQLNNDTNGLEWRKGINKNGKSILWCRAISQEAGELMDSYPWKWWKNIDTPADIVNAHIEIADIWHFVMSIGLKMENPDDAMMISEDALSCQSETPYSLDEILDAIDEMKKFCSDRITTERAQPDNLDKIGFTVLMYHFADICIKCGLKFNELYTLYISKNCLNKFRQDHGYTTGDYIKVWNGVEDNKVMKAIIEDIGGVESFNDLYSALEARYKAL